MVDAVTTNQAASRTQTGRIGLTNNFETFLKLLTTQLKNQDPLSPLDSNEFTAQLTQMSGVEQQLLTNDLLTSLLAAQQGNLGSASNHIGKDVTAVWATTELQDGSATWAYELGDKAASASLEIVDGQGKVVWTGPAPSRERGIHDFRWDGRSTTGAQLPDGGVYTLRVAARDAANAPAPAQVLTRGRVTGVEMYDGKPYLTIAGAIVPMSSVIALREPPSTPTAASPVARMASAAMSIF